MFALAVATSFALSGVGEASSVDPVLDDAPANAAYTVQDENSVDGMTYGSTSLWKHTRLAWWDPVFGGWFFNSHLSGYNFFVGDSFVISTLGYTLHEVCNGGDCSEVIYTYSWL